MKEKPYLISVPLEVREGLKEKKNFISKTTGMPISLKFLLRVVVAMPDEEFLSLYEKGFKNLLNKKL